MVQPNEMPHRGQDHGSASSDEAQEEYNDEWVLVIHQVVAQTGATVGDATICKGEVEFSERRRDVTEDEAIEEAYGRVSGLVRA